MGYTKEVKDWIKKTGYKPLGKKKPTPTKKKVKPHKTTHKARAAKLTRCLSDGEVINVKASKSEKSIAKFLQQNNISFIQEYPITVNGKMNLFFDFYLPNYTALIEFDGIHHFKPVYVDKRFADTKRYDAIKNRWAKQNGKRLLRISCIACKDVNLEVCRFLDHIAPIV